MLQVEKLGKKKNLYIFICILVLYILIISSVSVSYLYFYSLYTLFCMPSKLALYLGRDLNMKEMMTLLVRGLTA